MSYIYTYKYINQITEKGQHFNSVKPGDFPVNVLIITDYVILIFSACAVALLLLLLLLLF